MRRRSLSGSSIDTLSYRSRSRSPPPVAIVAANPRSRSRSPVSVLSIPINRSRSRTPVSRRRCLSPSPPRDYHRGQSPPSRPRSRRRLRSPSPSRRRACVMPRPSYASRSRSWSRSRSPSRTRWAGPSRPRSRSPRIARRFRPPSRSPLRPPIRYTRPTRSHSRSPIRPTIIVEPICRYRSPSPVSIQSRFPDVPPIVIPAPIPNSAATLCHSSYRSRSPVIIQPPPAPIVIPACGPSTTPLCIQPPPSYLACAAPVNHDDIEQQSLLLPGHDKLHGNGKDKRQIIKLVGIYLLLFFAIVASIVQLSIRFSPDPLSPVERERARKEWQIEKAARESERQHWKEERKRWEVDRSKHEEEQRRWARERAVELSRMWNEPRVNSQCAGYNKREYIAYFDPLSACKMSPLVIHNRTIGPTECTTGDGRDPTKAIIGRWVVDFDEPACRPHWDGWKDKGCTWWGSGMHRMEATLRDVNRGDDWDVMCSSTPADINGVHFDRPTKCERGVGIFEWSDSDCLWNIIGQKGKST